MVTRVKEKHGAQLVGEVVQYQNSYRLCYVRAADGLLIGLAQELILPDYSLQELISTAKCRNTPELMKAHAARVHQQKELINKA